MAYRLLGFVVWRGARWYVRRRTRARLRRRALAVGGGLALAVAGAAVLLARRSARA